MSKFKLSKRSLAKLDGVHPALVDVVKLAITYSEVDFLVIEGLRTLERQRELVAKGASKTLNGRHISGHAVDLAPWVGEVRWDWPLFEPIAEAMKRAATELNVKIVWGGSWRPLIMTPSPITQAQLHPRFPDGPHFELDRKAYPA